MFDEEIIRTGLLVANEIVNFERHSAFFCWQRPERRLLSWHYRQGFQAADTEAKLSHFEAVQSRFAKRLAVSQSGASEQSVDLRLRCIPNASGFLSVSRTTQPYSEHELWLLSLVSKITSAAFESPTGLEILRALHLILIDQRVYSRSATSRQILEAYVEKAAFIIHPEHFDGLALPNVRPALPSRSHKCRVDAKLISPNMSCLSIVAALSRPDEDYCDADFEKVYELDNRNSIAAQVFKNCRPHRSENVQEDKFASPLFQDSISHISAPILYGEPRTQGEINIPQCLGVISVETSRPSAYSEGSLVALSILAAHAAWPLGRAMLREEIDRNARERQIVRSTSAELTRCESDDSVLSILECAFIALGYSRGLFCRVIGDDVVGFRSWGGKAMADLCKTTIRHRYKDKGDCQPIAAWKQEPVIIRDPANDQRANRSAIEVAGLKHFAVVPICSAHAETTYTVHIERKDLLPISKESDIPLIADLLIDARDAFERIRIAEHQNEWIRACLYDEYAGENALLESLAKRTVEAGVAKRCRVYLIKNKTQIGLLQAGASQIEGFQDFVLSDHSENLKTLRLLVSKKRPVVVVADGRKKSAFRNSQFEVRIVHDIPHELELQKQGVREWIEAPVFTADGSLYAKLVYDQQGIRDKRFTPTELQWISTTSGAVSFLIESIAQRQLTLSLASEGLAADAIRHAVSEVVTLAINQLDDSANAKNVMDSAQSTLAMLRDLTRKDRESLPLHEELQQIRALAEPFLRVGRIGIHCSQRARQDIPKLLADSGFSSSFTWIVLKLVLNAVRAVNSSADKKWDDGLEVRVTLRLGKGGIRSLVVSNNGSGLPNSVLKQFNGPVVELAGVGIQGQGRGLAYARMLAERQGWQLHHKKSTQWPTQFQLDFSVLDRSRPI